MTPEDTCHRVKGSIDILFEWVTRQQYTGWDVYDGLNSPLFRNIPNPYIKYLILQGNKFSPINFRPLLKIEQGIDVKGMAVFAHAYALRYRSTGDERYLCEMQNAVAFLKEKSLKKDIGYDCWASHYYPYVAIDKHALSVDTPDIIGTSQAIMALVESYKITGDPTEKEIALSATDFLIDELFHDDDSFPSFEYSKSLTRGTHITLNASAEAMEAISSTLEIENTPSYKAVCEKVAGTLVRTQRANGSWDHSIYRDGSTKRVQLDFHQGYIIDGLLAFLPHAVDPDLLADCIRKGVTNYKSVLFRENGTSYYRHPLPFPIDIHNQAQGIITFVKLSRSDERFRSFAEKILTWTIDNMQDRSGFFYYQKWPLITNKIPYMRWGQAWMSLALATFHKHFIGGTP